MTIHEYIKKHSLTVISRQPTPNLYAAPLPAVLLESKASSPGDRFEIYANADRTHFVSLNLSRQEFRILHYELVFALSEWHPADGNYQKGNA